MARKRASKQKVEEPKVVPFPKILKDRLSQLSMESNNAVIEVMGMMRLAPGEWQVDLHAGVFVKAPEKPQPEPAQPEQ